MWNLHGFRSRPRQAVRARQNSREMGDGRSVIPWIAALGLAGFAQVAQSQCDCALETRGIPKGSPIGRTQFVHTISCSGCEGAAGEKIYTVQSSGTFVSTAGCEEGDSAVPVCTFSSDEAVIVYNLPSPGTSINFTCIISGPDDNPDNDCTCTKVTWPNTFVCTPVAFFVFADGFESGDASAWSGVVP